jgi:hypothetical protein
MSRTRDHNVGGAAVRWDQNRPAGFLAGHSAPPRTDVAGATPDFPAVRYRAARGQPERTRAMGSVDDEWMRALSCAGPLVRAAAPTDFTSQVMARISAQPVVAPVCARHQHLRSVRVAGGVVAVSTLLVVGTLATAVLVMPTQMLSLLNSGVAALVSLLTVLAPIMAMASALVSNDLVMLGVTAMVVGALLVWSRMLHPAPHALSEA